MENTSYKLNADGTIRVIKPRKSDFVKRLEEKYPTPNADKLVKDNPEIEKFDTHKWLK